MTVCNICDNCKEARRQQDTQTTFTKISRAFDPFKFSELTECVICLDDFTEEAMVTALPCDHRHYFHTKCIQEWSQNKRTCPLCNAEYDYKQIRDFNKKLSVRIEEWRAKEGLPTIEESRKSAIEE